MSVPTCEQFENLEYKNYTFDLNDSALLFELKKYGLLCYMGKNTRRDYINLKTLDYLLFCQLFSHAEEYQGVRYKYNELELLQHYNIIKMTSNIAQFIHDKLYD